MCGITGYYHPERGRDVDEGVLAQMCAAIAHRGPDSEGRLCRDGMALGMRRLSIIDIHGGEQPMWNTARNVAVTFNGEIYNFRELRDDLKAKGYAFRTNCDTEVLVHLYDEYGPEMLTQLNGMFGLAIADFPKRRVLLARDRLGIKPLFLTQALGALNDNIFKNALAILILFRIAETTGASGPILVICLMMRWPKMSV